MVLCSLNASPNEDENDIAKATRFIIVPGVKGGGGKHVIAEKIVNPAQGHVQFAKTPTSFPDLGQSRCQAALAESITPLQDDDNVKNIVIHATSQGTATVLNYVAEHPEKISAIILESVMASGNSAIYHTVKSCLNSKLASLSALYYCLPYTSKLSKFVCYNPTGRQAIFACEKLPHNIPIIIIHATQDPEIAFNDAKAIYYALTARLNLSVYLIAIDEQKHHKLLNQQYYNCQIKAINMIMKNHDLPYHHDMIDNHIRLFGFQPNRNDYEQNYLDLMKRETKLQTIDGYLKSTIAVLFWVICAYISFDCEIIF